MQDIFQKIVILPEEDDIPKAIRGIQEYVNNSVEFLKLDERIQDILSEFAYDLDFYEHDPILRSEDPSLYGKERLKEEVKIVIGKLGVLLNG